MPLEGAEVDENNRGCANATRAALVVNGVMSAVRREARRLALLEVDERRACEARFAALDRDCLIIFGDLMWVIR